MIKATKIAALQTDGIFKLPPAYLQQFSYGHCTSPQASLTGFSHPWNLLHRFLVTWASLLGDLPCIEREPLLCSKILIRDNTMGGARRGFLTSSQGAKEFSFAWKGWVRNMVFTFSLCRLGNHSRKVTYSFIKCLLGIYSVKAVC